jgi:hypothetical protein
VAKKASSDPGESTSAYFRRIFLENPKWIKSGSNQEVMDRWLADHPGDREVPQKAKFILSNVKLRLRSKRRRKVVGSDTATETLPPASPIKLRGLDRLEAAIDDCLAEAKSIHREALHDVITLLRAARNALVLKAEVL